METAHMNREKLPSLADRFIDIDQLKIAYADKGSGQVILCLHALGHSSKDFSSLYDLPLAEFRVISVDFPGHGLSDEPTQPVSSLYFSTLIRKFIEKLDLRNIIVVGNSIGGATAIRIASDQANVKQLALSNPAGLDKRGWLAPFFLNYMIHFFRRGAAGKPNFKAQFARYYNRVWTSKSASLRKIEIVRDAYQLAPLLVQGWTSFKSKDEDLRPLIETIKCPVLFTWAMRDQFVQFGRNKSAIKKFSNFKLIKYQIGHTPYVECPEMHLRDFLEFVNKNRDLRAEPNREREPFNAGTAVA